MTIGCAANTKPMPMMTPIGQPQEMRPAAAAIPNAMTRSTAMGVAIVVIEVTRFVAPDSADQQSDFGP